MSDFFDCQCEIWSDGRAVGSFRSHCPTVGQNSSDNLSGNRKIHPIVGPKSDIADYRRLPPIIIPPDASSPTARFFHPIFHPTHRSSDQSGNGTPAYDTQRHTHHANTQIQTRTHTQVPHNCTHVHTRNNTHARQKHTRTYTHAHKQALQLHSSMELGFSCKAEQYLFLSCWHVVYLVFVL